MAIFAPRTSSEIFMMSFALLLIGMAKMTSGGVFCSASDTILYSASASVTFPVPARAMPRAKCQNLIPFVKANIHGHRDGHETFERRHVFDMRADICHQQASILLGFRIVAIHAV